MRSRCSTSSCGDDEFRQSTSCPVPMNIPERFNAAECFINRHLEEGRADRVTILFGEGRLTYRQVSEQVNHAANAPRECGAKKDSHVLILLPDSPAFVAAFWGAIKLGAIATPTNTVLAGG